MPITEREIKAAKPGPKLVRMPDGQGLYLEVRPSGTKTFIARYKVRGVPRSLTIGTFPDVKLAAARQENTRIKMMVRAGLDPKTGGAPEPAQEDIPFERLFENVVDRFIEKRQMEGIAEATLRKLRWNLGEAKKVFAGRDIGSIKPSEVLRLVERIQGSGKLEKAKDIHRKLGQVFDYAIGLDDSAVEWNPAVNGGAKSGHGAEQKSASLGVTGALANVLPI